MKTNDLSELIRKICINEGLENNIPDMFIEQQSIRAICENSSSMVKEKIEQEYYGEAEQMEK